MAEKNKYNNATKTLQNFYNELDTILFNLGFSPVKDNTVEYRVYGLYKKDDFLISCFIDKFNCTPEGLENVNVVKNFNYTLAEIQKLQKKEKINKPLGNFKMFSVHNNLDYYVSKRYNFFLEYNGVVILTGRLPNNFGSENNKNNKKIGETLSKTIQSILKTDISQLVIFNNNLLKYTKVNHYNSYMQPKKLTSETNKDSYTKCKALEPNTILFNRSFDFLDYSSYYLVIGKHLLQGRDDILERTIITVVKINCEHENLIGKLTILPDKYRRFKLSTFKLAIDNQEIEPVQFLGKQSANEILNFYENDTIVPVLCSEMSDTKNFNIKSKYIEPLANEYNLDILQTYILSLAISKNLNFTELLNKNYDFSTMTYLVNMLEEYFDISEYNLEFSKEAIALLKGYQKRGYCIENIINNLQTGDVNEISNVFATLTQGFKKKREELRQEGFNETQLDYIQAIATYRKGYDWLLEYDGMCTKNFTTIKLMLINELHKHKWTSFIKKLLDVSQTLCGNKINATLNKQYIDINEIKEELNYNKDIKVYNDITWKKIIDDTLEDMYVSVYYDILKGFLLKVKTSYLFECYLGKDKNSLFIAGADFNIIFRIIYLNGKEYILDNGMSKYVKTE